jgi:hypothetical protein
MFDVMTVVPDETFYWNDSLQLHSRHMESKYGDTEMDCLQSSL